MANKNIEISINATAAGLERGVSRAENSLSRLQRAHSEAWAAINAGEKWLQGEQDAALAHVEAREARRAEVYQQAGTVMVGAGAAIAAGLGAAAGAAVQWESDWAGVTKVLDGTPQQMAVLEEQMRGLATTMPATSSEIAATAAAAGQLGVAKEDLVGFTSTAVMLGTATDLASDEAATGLARLSTVMGVSYGDIGKMGSSIVSLGNNFAATESEILAMSLRLSGAGNQIGLTAGETMGLATAFSSVGIQAELGGGAFSRALGRIQSAVLEGGERLDNLATVAGVSAEEFATAFQERPNEAIVMFLQGLERVKESGGSVYSTLADLGLTGTEIADVMTRAASASGLVAEAMGVGNTAFADGNALLEEAAARYETTESQVQIAKNSLNDLGISIGNNLLPAIGSAAGATQNWLILFNDMPAGVQTAVTGTTALAGAASLAAGAFLLGVPKVAEFKNSMADMGPRTQAVGRGLGAVAGVLGGPWGIALAGAVLVGGAFINSQAEAAGRVNDLTNALIQSNGAIDENVEMTAVKTLADEGLLEKAREAGISLELVRDAYLGQTGAMKELDEQLLKTIDSNTTWNESMWGTTPEYNDQAVAASELGVAMQGLSGDYDESLQKAQDQQEALGGTTERAGETTGAVDGLTGSQAMLGETTGEATTQVRDLRKELTDLTDTSFNAMDAEYSFEAAVRAASESVSTNGGTLNKNSEAGYKNWQALTRLRDETLKLIDAKYKETGSMNDARKAYNRGRKALVDLAMQSGMTRKEANKLADELLGMPSDISIGIDVDAKARWTIAKGGFSARGKSGGMEMSLYADGGEVVGEGGPRDDQVPAMLSNGEHVLPADEVEQAGGQAGVYRLRSAIRQGYVRFAVGGAVGEDERQRFAKGGAVLSKPAREISELREDVRIGIQRMIMATVDGAAKDIGKQVKKYMGSASAVVRAATSQAGVMYSWGGGGPNGPSRGFGRGAGTVGFDCSSLMQYAWWQGARVMLPRVTYSQISSGRAVARGQERPGDLLFPHRGHVAMWVSPGRMFHTNQTGTPARYAPAYSNPIAIRRPGRFDQGGVWGINSTGQPERVLDPRQTRAFEILVDGVLSRFPAGGSPAQMAGGGGDQITYVINHVPGYSTAQDLQRADAQRQRQARVGRRR